MRATGAYIASAGTAFVMLAASLATLALVSTLVAFGSWPGTGAGSQVDQVLVTDVRKAEPKPIPVRADAVQVARRADVERQAAAAHARTSTRTVDRAPTASAAANAPSRSAPSAATPAAAATPVTAPTSGVQQGAQQVTQTLDTTTHKLAGQVTQPAGEVVNQVAAPVQQSAPPVVQQVQDTAGSVLPH